jgi:hypothetical protein
VRDAITIAALLGLVLARAAIDLALDRIEGEINRGAR